MTRSISWKVTAACSGAWMLMLLAAVSGYTQPVREAVIQKRVTLHSEHLSAEAVLQHIEALAQIHFVYSSSLIELSKTLPVSFQDRPLREVLDVIGKQLGLELRMQGNYVILKKPAAPLPRHSFSEGGPIASRLPRPVVLQEAPPIPTYAPEPAWYQEDSLISYRTLKRSLLRGKSNFGLDTISLRRYLKQPVHTVLKPDTRSRWQVSLTVFANDYSVGTEVRAGLRSLYVVGSTSYMSGGYFRNGLGAGSSINIKPGIQISPIYTYGRMKYKEDFSPFGILKVNAQHHQMKLLLALAVTDHFNFQIGPTFNVLKKHYNFQREGFRKIVMIRQATMHGQVSASNAGWTESTGSTGSGPQYGQTAEPGQDLPFATKTTDLTTPAHRRFELDALKTWVGFETGITYTINFSRRP